MSAIKQDLNDAVIMKLDLSALIPAFLTPEKTLQIFSEGNEGPTNESKRNRSGRTSEK